VDAGKRKIRAAEALLLITVCAGSITAQTVIRGEVIDPTGASVPDATVELWRGGGNPVRAAQTDFGGRFGFTAVAAGSYTIRVQHQGFKAAASHLRVTSGATAPITIRLELADVFSEVQAEFEPVQVIPEVSENRDAAAVSDNLLEKLPVFDQDYIGRMSMFLDSASIGTKGASLVVDGMEVNNAGITASAIKEVRINQNPYSAEFFRPGRGRIEIITKDAGAAYHGALNFMFRDSYLNARDPFALTRAPEQRRIWEGALSGPVGHSKNTSFLLSGARQEDDLQAVIFARGLEGPIQTTAASPRGLTQTAARISHQFSTNHAAFWQYNDREYSGHDLGIGGLVLPDAGTNPDDWEREIVYNDRLTLSPHWINQFQILVGREHEGMHGVNSAPSVVVQGAFTGGGAQVDILRTENHFQASDIASYSAGRHLLKIGVNVPDWSRRGVDEFSNFGGTFYFSSLADYAAQHPYAYTAQQGTGHVVYVQKELGGFAQDEIKLKRNLSLALGLRYDWQNFLHDDNNFSPRLALAWAPRGSKSTVIRGGGGVFYDRTGYVPMADLVLHDGTHLHNFLIENPAFPNPGPLAGQPAGLVRLDPSIREPYLLQYGATVERQVAKRATATVAYRGNRGVKMYRSRDANAPLPPDYLVRPNPAVGVLRQIESSGRQAGDSLDVTVQGEITHWFTGVAQYTLAETKNDSGGIAWFPANQYDPSGEWSRADFDQRHRFNMLGSFTPAKRVSLGVGVSLNSGSPYTITTGTDPFHTGMSNARPPGLSRNSLQGPGYADLDLRFARDFYVSRAKKDKGAVATVGLDAFDALNRVNYAGYVGSLTSPFFGKPIATLPTRRLQLTVRLKF
jgi:Carboxypeptidase regulatory-like domain/TonB dependent receptor-like, beta-barrel